MAQEELELLLIDDGRQVKFKAVKVKNSFVIYKDGKALTAVHKYVGNWEQLLFAPIPEALFLQITAKLDEMRVK